MRIQRRPVRHARACASAIVQSSGHCPREQRLQAVLSLLVTLLLGAPPAAAQVERFDGEWKVTLTCPPHETADDDARGYTHRFAARIDRGELRGTYGTEGEIGYHHLYGTVRADGSANLRLDGIVNDPRHAIRKAQRGKPYTYRVGAKFDERSGFGQRQSGRACEFTFAR